MTKYVFKKLKEKDNPFDVSEITMEVEVDRIDDLIQEFGNFLKCSGYTESTVNKALGKEDE